MVPNRSFKDRIGKHYDAWLNEDNHAVTSTGKIERASASVIVE